MDVGGVSGRALSEFKAELPRIKRLLTVDWDKGRKSTASLKLVRLTCESAVEAVYRYALNDQVRQEKLFARKAVITSTWCDSSESLVYVGRELDSGVISIHPPPAPPREFRPVIIGGVYFSRGL